VLRERIEDSDVFRKVRIKFDNFGCREKVDGCVVLFQTDSTQPKGRFNISIKHNSFDRFNKEMNLFYTIRQNNQVSET
jgi:hypothetical protein